MFKIVRNTMLVAAVAALMTTSASAEDKDFGQIYSECGLGGIFGSAVNDRETSKIVAVITNVTWDLGTTASTSAYSSESTCANKKVRVANFINQSYEKLEKELAQGEGTYLDALTNLVFEEKAANAEYIAALRAKFATVVAEDGYSKLSRYEKVEKLYSIAL